MGSPVDMVAFEAVCNAAKSVGPGSDAPELLGNEKRSRGFASGGLTVLSDRTVKKKLVRPQSGIATRWLNEVLFYSEIRNHLPLEGIYIPALQGIEVISRNEVILQIEYCDCKPVLSPEVKKRLATEFGRLNARARRLELHTTVWLPKSPGVGPIASYPSVVETKKFLTSHNTWRWEAFQAFLEEAPALQAAYKSCIPTLCHGDANQQNALHIVESDRFCILDWARINSGMIGDDLCRLITPWLVKHTQNGNVDEINRIENELFECYVSGVHSVLTEANKHLIATAFQIRSVVIAIAIASHLNRWVNADPRSDIRTRREKRVLAFYEIMANRAASLCKEAVV